GRYFSRGVLAVGRPAALPAAAVLGVDIETPELDVDAWRRVADDMGANQKTVLAAAAGASDEILPPLDQLTLKTKRLRIAGQSLDDLTLAATRSQPLRWQMDLTSRQAVGSLSWQEASGAIAGQVVARFKRLALGAETDVATSMPVTDGPTPEAELSSI